jgi:hypothetical protein
MTDTDFDNLKKSVDNIEEALLGNALTGKLGVLHHHNQMYAFVTGIQADGTSTHDTIKNSMLARISKVEDNQKKIIWMGAGISAGAATAWTIILKFVGK